ncbi:acetyl-CoA synthetase-like protein, partial [Ramicandelaber brevisporus]
MPASTPPRYAQQTLHARSLADRPQFWLDAARAIDWHRAPSTAHDFPYGDISPLLAEHARWFPDGELNICHNALDRHVSAGRGDHTAVVYDSPVTGTVRKYSFAEALDAVKRIAAVLHNEYGVRKGDPVMLYMPMIPEGMFGILACARLGAVFSVVFGGFAPPELAKRIKDFKPKVILTASCGIEKGKVIEYLPLVNEALELCSREQPTAVRAQKLVFQRTREFVAPLDAADGERSWNELVAAADPRGAGTECTWVPAHHPLYVLYTSGTTAMPKQISRDTGGHAVALAWNAEHFLGLRSDGRSVMFANSDFGWVVGVSFIVLAPLIAGSATVLFEGKPTITPDPSTYYRIVSDHKVTSLFTAPTALSILRREDPDGVYRWRGKAAGAPGGTFDLSSLKYAYVAGERCVPDILRWFRSML